MQNTVHTFDPVEIQAALTPWIGPLIDAWDARRPVPTEMWWDPAAPDDGWRPEGRLAALHAQAVAGELAHWRHDPLGCLALVVLLDQCHGRAHAGTAQALAHGAQAAALAASLLDEGPLAALPPAGQALLALALGRPETAAASQAASEAMGALARDPRTRGGRRLYRRLLAHTRRDLTLRRRFGRDPRYNAMLGRPSTMAECCCLDQRARGGTAPAPAPLGPPVRLLVLHGMTQSGAFLKAQTRRLQRALEGVATLRFVDGPHLTGDGEDEGRRCWWASQGEPRRYVGWPQSLSALEAIWADEGPFDGVLGFSQGACAAALLAAESQRRPDWLVQPRFVICVGGFPARSVDEGPLMAGPALPLPSLHIYGESDERVTPDRALALAARFEGAAVATHPGGHFAPDRWPMDTLQAFVRRFVRPLTPGEQRARVDASAVEGWATPETPLEAARDQVIEGLKSMTLEALLTATCGLYVPPDYGPVEDIKAPLPGDALYRLWLGAALARPETVMHLSVLRDRCGLAALSRLGLLAFGAGMDEVFEEAAACIAEALMADVARQAAGRPVSEAALEAPRAGGAVDRCCGLARAVARRMDEGEVRRTAYARYRRVVSGLAQAWRDQRARIERPGGKGRGVPRWSAEALAAPISEAIVEPLPVPVVPCPLDALSPLLQHLARRQEILGDAVAFPRGTLMADGRLDLCKQVVGPAGIGPLLGAVEGNPQVKRLLLGNNIVGNVGAGAIAEFIRQGQSPVQVWYIAGNHIDAQGLQPICEALADQRAVEGLWLKRNPLKAAGAAHVGALLAQPTGLVTLDLVNTGLLDEGLAHVIRGLAENTSLRHLYLGANGITAEGVLPLARYLGTSNRLRSLYVSTNRLGDAGVMALAEALAADGRRAAAGEAPGLRRLSLASNRVGPEGATALARAVAEHPTLEALSLGWNRATAAVGELGNQIGRRGVSALADAVAAEGALRALDVSHNHLAMADLTPLLQACHQTSRLVSLRATQYGQRLEQRSLEAVDRALAANAEAQGIEAEAVWTPRPTREILSVYRTAD